MNNPTINIIQIIGLLSEIPDDEFPPASENAIIKIKIYNPNKEVKIFVSFSVIFNFLFKKILIISNIKADQKIRENQSGKYGSGKKSKYKATVSIAIRIISTAVFNIFID